MCLCGSDDGLFYWIETKALIQISIVNFYFKITPNPVCGSAGVQGL